MADITSGRAGVFVEEIDLSARTPAFPGLYGAMVLNLNKGVPNVPTLNTSETSFFNLHTQTGSIEPGDSLGLFEAQAFLRKSNKLWTIRPENDSRYGGAWLAQDIPFHEISVSVNQGLNTLNFRTVTSTDSIIADTMYNTFSDGDVVRVTVEANKGGVLPIPLQENTNYYVVKFNEELKSIQLAISLEDSFQREIIEFTSTGNNVILTIPQDKRNGEQEFGVKTPSAYLFNTSDGKPSGINSSFHVDFDGDFINVTKEYYNTVSTGDMLQLKGAISDLPSVNSGLPLEPDQIVYAIKLPMEGQNADKYKIKIARTLLEAQSELYIDFLTRGNSFTLLNTSKSVTSQGTIDINQDSISVLEPKFLSSLALNDKLTFTFTIAPTLEDGTSLNNSSTYYAIPGINSFMIAKEINGTPINFDTEGTDIVITNMDKSNSTQGIIDLSNDRLVVDEVYYDMVETGFECTVKSDGTLPSGLVSGTTYYVIKTETEKTIMLASTQGNAELGISLDITDEGTIDVSLNQYHVILDTHNELLSGFNEKIGYLHTSTPCNEELYFRLLHYPYANPEDWTDEDQILADTIQEPGAFKLWIYKINDVGEALELENFTMSRDPKHIDGFGQNIYCENVALRSNYIRWIDNKTVDKSIYPVQQPTLGKLTGGSNGHSVTTGEAILSLYELYNKRKYPMTIIMDAGKNIPAFQQALIDLCEKRMTSLAILSTPISVEQSNNYLEDIADYRRRQLIANTSHAAIYSPHLKIYDAFNDREIFISPTGHVGAQISETAATKEIWYAPAGAIRGKLNVLGLSREFTQGDMDYLYGNNINVNPIEFHETKGIRIWGQKTLLTRASTLDRVNARLLLCVVEDSLESYLEDNVVFEFNDEITRATVVTNLTSYLEGIKRRRGLYSYLVVCNEENNTFEVIDRNELIVSCFLQITKSAEFIRLQVIITRTGASFSLDGLA